MGQRFFGSFICHKVTEVLTKKLMPNLDHMRERAISVAEKLYFVIVKKMWCTYTFIRHLCLYQLPFQGLMNMECQMSHTVFCGWESLGHYQPSTRMLQQQSTVDSLQNIYRNCMQQAVLKLRWARTLSNYTIPQNMKNVPAIIMLTIYSLLI